MKPEKKQQLETEYKQHIEKWAEEHLNNNCFYREFDEKCIGKYTQRLAFNILVCDTCGSKLINFTFEEWLQSKRSSIKASIRQNQYDIENISIDLERLKKEKRELRNKLKNLRKYLKKWC